MAMLIADPRLAEKLKAERKARGIDHHDEVWEGVYFMAPLENNEHQKLVMALGSILYATIDMAGLGEAFPGVNLAGFGDNWEHDYRAPDVVVFLTQTAAEDKGTYWRGAADFVIEITSPEDRTYEKIPFYSRLCVRELLIVNRQPWALELYRREESGLVKVGASILKPESIERGDQLSSAVVPLRFQLIPGQPRPKIEVTHVESGQQWVA